MDMEYGVKYFSVLRVRLLVCILFSVWFLMFINKYLLSLGWFRFTKYSVIENII